MAKKEQTEQSFETSIKCLDHGFVRGVDFMGDDAAIVQAARTSYGKGTKKRSEDRSLIRYMMRNKHTSVFEQVVMKFHVKAPLFVFRQWHRHRTWSYNELSGRYSEMPDTCYVPALNRIQEQSATNKQGSAGELDFVTQDFTQAKMSAEQRDTFDNYHNYIKRGVAREISRINLPLSTYSEMYATVDLHNLFHFLRLRLDSHAQYEIRVYAEAIYKLIKPVVPTACQAFEDYVLNAQTFSAQEMEWLKESLEALQLNSNCNWDDELQRLPISKRELKKFKTKLNLE